MKLEVISPPTTANFEILSDSASNDENQWHIKKRIENYQAKHDAIQLNTT
jgi:hypothetical protein